MPFVGYCGLLLLLSASTSVGGPEDLILREIFLRYVCKVYLKPLVCASTLIFTSG